VAAAAAVSSEGEQSGEVVVPVVGGLDIHRAQLTFDYVDLDSGEVCRGRIAPADREQLRQWLERFADRSEVAFALEGCTGWRYVVEELQRAGIEAHLAEPAETAARRGPKRRAKTDRSDARLLRELLLEGRIPESWIPPQPVLEARALVRLYKDLLEERTGWLQRVHASMFHMGAPELQVKTMSKDGRERMSEAQLSPATRTAVAVGMSQVDRLTADMVRLREQIATISRRQPACRALQAAHYGVGPLISVAIWSEMGDTRRFHSSDDAVRHAGLDVTSTPPTGAAPAAGWPARARSCCAGHCMRRPSTPDAPAHPTIPTSSRSRTASMGNSRCCQSPASSPGAATTPCAAWAIKSSPRLPDPTPGPRPRRGCVSRPTTDEPRPAPSNPVAAGNPAGQPTKNERPHPYRRDTPIAILSPDLQVRAPR
jgi:transposase